MPKSDRPEFADTAETRLTLRRIFIEFYLEDNDFCTELIGLADGFNGPVTDGNLSMACRFFRRAQSGFGLPQADWFFLHQQTFR